MNTPDTEITHKGIIIIQSLKDNERKTGDELQKDILQYKKYLHDDSFVEFYNVTTIKEFIKTLGNIEKSMSYGRVFSLHLETHGSEEGIHLSSGECMSWKLFFDNIRPINIKMCHLLIVVMAMCKGGAIISYIEPEKRAPYLAFIGAFRDLRVDEVVRGFSAFYGEYTSMLDISKGMNALDAEIDGINPPKNTFWCYTAESIFDLTFNPDRDPKHFKEMVKQQLDNQIARGNTHYTLEKAEDDIRKLLKHTSEKYRDYYCFNDILEK